jgi:hypothetical protein
MIYSQHGKTGANVSAVGFGGMRFDMKQSIAKNAELIKYSYDKGINYFDTAPGYCDDKSEIIFGEAIKQLASKRDSFYVATKSMPETFDTAEKAYALVEKSLKRLNTDYIDFYHVWCVRKFDQYELSLKPGGQYEGLLKAKEKGMIKHIAVSTHLRGPEVERMLSKKQFEAVLLGVNLLNFQYRWQGVEAANKLGMGVVAMNPIGGGVIPQNEDKLGYLAVNGLSPTEAALNFIISSPEINVALNGFTTREHIDTACKVADNARQFSADDLKKIKRHVTENIDKLCTGCGYCMGLCPKDIPIADYMQYYNGIFLSTPEDKMADALKMEYIVGPLADRKTDAKECIECGRCEQACTQHLDIIKRLKNIAKWQELVESQSDKK